ncbi:hypothetical protein MTP99_008539 [Tenebrio molitor]|nr:hypothetical protein MTP99_008539 [Tenebrio molitor]
MARHMKYECGKLPMFGCSKCPYRGYQKTHVERHLSRKHNILLKSDIIRAIIRSESTDALCALARTNTPALSTTTARTKRLYTCPKCLRAYKHSQSLHRHKKFECGKEPLFRCTVPDCQFVSKVKCNLKQHLFRHSKQWQDCKYKNWNVAGSLFSPVGIFGLKQLKYKIVMSLLLGAYQCPICLRRYKVQRSLWRHQKYECQKEPAFQCPRCEHRAKHKSSILKHIFSVHTDDNVKPYKHLQ